MKIQVLIPKPVPAAPKYMPITLEKLGLAKGGLLLDGEHGGVFPFKSIRAVSVFLDDLGAPLLLLFVRDREQPYLVGSEKIEYGAFRIETNDREENLKKLVLGLCRKDPGIRVDRGAYQFLSGRSPLVRVRDVPVFCASLGFALEEDVRDRSAALEQHAVPMPRKLQPPPPPVPTTMQCPKCGVEQPIGPDCAHCGIVIQKFLEKQKRRGTLHPREQPATAADTDSDISKEMDDRDVSGKSFSYVEPGEGIAEGYRIISVDSVFRLAFGLLSRHLGPLAGISTIIMVLAISGSFLLSSMLLNAPFIAAFLGFFFFLAVSIYLALCVAYFVHAVVDERICTVGESLAEGARRLVPAMLSRISNMFLIVLGYFAFVVPGIIFFVRGIFIEIIAATENPFGQLIASRGQVSHNLVRDYGFSIFATVLMALNLLTLIIFGLFMVFFLAGLNNPFSGLFPIALVVLGWVLVFMAGVYLTIVLYLLFIDLKAIKGDYVYSPQDSVDLLLRIVLWIDAFLFIGAMMFILTRR